MQSRNNKISRKALGPKEIQPIYKDGLICQDPIKEQAHSYNMHSEILDNIQDEIKSIHNNETATQPDFNLGKYYDVGFQCATQDAENHLAEATLMAGILTVDPDYMTALNDFLNTALSQKF